MKNTNQKKTKIIDVIVDLEKQLPISPILILKGIFLIFKIWNTEWKVSAKILNGLGILMGLFVFSNLKLRMVISIKPPTNNKSIWALGKKANIISPIVK